MADERSDSLPARRSEGGAGGARRAVAPGRARSAPTPAAHGVPDRAVRRRCRARLVGRDQPSLDRFVDTLVGGVVSVVVSVLLLPVNPIATARREIDPLLATLAELIDHCATAVADGDRAGAALTLAKARETQAAVDAVREALAQARSLAVDVLRATGLDRDRVLRLLPSLPQGPVSYG